MGENASKPSILEIAAAGKWEPIREVRSLDIPNVQPPKTIAEAIQVAFPMLPKEGQEVLLIHGKKRLRLKCTGVFHSQPHEEFKITANLEILGEVND